MINNGDLAPYDIACEFIRLHDIGQTMNSVGITPSRSMQQTMGDYRDMLDKTLSRHRVPTSTEWDVHVRRRLHGDG